jgi:hypothetical protein
MEKIRNLTHLCKPMSAMNQLTTAQQQHLRQHLTRSGSPAGFSDELLHHFAEEVAHYQWHGFMFEGAVANVLHDAGGSLIDYLCYRHQLDPARLEATTAPTLDDMVFATRNRAYGAFPLRRAYTSTLTVALLGGIGLFLMVLAGVGFVNQRAIVYTSSLGAMWIAGAACLAIAGGLAVFQQLYRQKLE